MIKSIRGYGDVESEQLDFLIYYILRSGVFTDRDGDRWRGTANVNEEFYVSCYSDGQQHSCKSIEELVETLKLLLEGSL